LAAQTRAGWTAGAGVEAAITGPLTAKCLYAEPGSMNCATAVCGGDERKLSRQHRARGPELSLLTASRFEIEKPHSAAPGFFV
jgi:hypothetical protein